MTELAACWPVVPSEEADWLVELTGDDGLTGFMPPPLPDAAWVLNAMYEHEHGPSDVSYDDRYRAELAEGLHAPRFVGSVDLTTVGIVPGGGLGRAEHPGRGWRRLRWRELARRVGDPLVPEELLPSYRCFPSAKKRGSWPLGIIPPTEGSLGRQTWGQLIEVLIRYSPAGADTRCLSYHSPLTLGTGDFDDLHVRAGRLGDTEVLYRSSELDFSPSNLWAEDRSWVVCTDYDLWATKVAGPAPLIGTLLHGPEIEAVRLPWAP